MTKKKKMTYSPPNLHSINNNELACLDGSGAADDGTCDTGATPSAQCSNGASAVDSASRSCSDGVTAYSTVNEACWQGNTAANPGADPCDNGSSPGTSPCLTGSGVT